MDSNVNSKLTIKRVSREDIEKAYPILLEFQAYNNKVREFNKPLDQEVEIINKLIKKIKDQDEQHLLKERRKKLNSEKLKYRFKEELNGILVEL